MFILVNGSGEVPSTEPLAKEISRASLQRMKNVCSFKYTDESY